MRRSAPQPAMRKTPTGGTAGTGSCQLLLGTPTPREVWEQRRGGDGDGDGDGDRLTEDGDYDDESG